MAEQLLIRPNMRYECHGDGTCCTSIHLLGPLKKSEAKAVEKASKIVFSKPLPKVVEYHPGNRDLALAIDKNRCVFLDERAHCRLHRAVGMDQKPRVCRRFPVGATQTPQGIRVTLSHRCPCVSIGDAPLLDTKRASAILARPKGGIGVDIYVGEVIRWRGRRTIGFDEYVAWERNLIEQLLGVGSARRDTNSGATLGEWLPRIENLLGMRSAVELPPLKGRTWDEVGKEMLAWTRDESDTDGFFCTVRWAGRELKDKRYPWRPPLRPWSWTLERTAKRVEKPVDIRRIFGTWIADFFWSMAWTADGCVHQALADICARYALANRLMDRLHETGARNDIAAAEAIMIVDTVAASDPWQSVKKHLKRLAE